MMATIKNTTIINLARNGKTAEAASAMVDKWGVSEELAEHAASYISDQSKYIKSIRHTYFYGENDSINITYMNRGDARVRTYSITC